jgi:hypothetical protein
MKPIAAAASRVVLLLSVSLGACHSGPTRLTVRPSTGSTVGDTTAFGQRLLTVDGKRHTVTFRVDAPAQVLLISVIPGESAVPVGALTSDTTRAEPGTHLMRFIDGPGAQTLTALTGPMTSQSLAQADYDRCVRVGTRSLPKKRVVKTDSTGKTFVDPDPELVDPHAALDVERGCEGRLNPAQTNAAARTPTSTRFLVLMASSTPLMLTDAIKRFEGMRNIPSDVPATVEAVAAALYGDRNGTWSAHYIQW